jgi:hypothetical protein
MYERLQTIIVTAEPGTWALWGLVILLASILLGVIWRRRLHGHRVRRLLRRIGCEYCADLVVPDGVGGVIYLDYLLLTPAGLVVMDVKNYQGVLFGSDNIQNWTQMVKEGSFKFTNPLLQNTLRVQAVRHLVPGVPVAGRVVFTPEGSFPRGRPAGVSMLNSLPDDLAFAPGAALPPHYRSAWMSLLAYKDSAGGRLPEHA